MPDVPMFVRPADPDAWHRVTAPGGYEWWYFDAEDATGRVRLVAILLEGFVFHPGYLRRHARYLRRPTRTPVPVPGDHPCAYFVLYQDGKVAGQFMAEYPPAAFAASADAPDVRVGPNRFWREPDGTLRLTLTGAPWHLTWQGPKLLTGQELSADLTFRPLTPTGPAVERTFLSRALSGADHQWILANPVCDVTGTVFLGESSAGGQGVRTAAAGTTVGQSIAFAGRGYHDHNYGTAPIGPGLKRWVWGRAIVPGDSDSGDRGGSVDRDTSAADRMYTFHFARPRDGRLPDEVHLVRADAGGVREVPVASAAVDWAGRSATLLRYPRVIDFGPHLKLTAPRVVDAAPFYLRLVYDAVVDGGAASTTAFCEVAYPHRLRWPLLGRMIELSIHRPAAGASVGSSEESPRWRGKSVHL
jgi:hypothetical protein